VEGLALLRTYGTSGMSSEEKTREQLAEELDRARKLMAELEEALRGYEERIDIHSQLSSDIFFSYDNTLKVLSVTPNVLRIAGYDPAELVGRNFNELEMLVHPEDVHDAYDSVDHVLSGKTVYPNIYRFFTKDGQKRFAEVSGVPIVRDGKVVAMVSRASDITRHVEMERCLRESEESCRRTLQRLPDAISIISRDDFRLLYVNDAFNLLTGYSHEETLGKNIFDLKLASGPTDNDGFRRVCRDGKEISRHEYRCRRKDGQYVDVLVSVRTLSYDDHDCMVMIMTDISSLLKKREEQGEGESRTLQGQKLEAVRTLAGGIAHDFNNILTTILGYTRMASRDVTGGIDSTVVKDELNEVRRAAQKARDLVNQLLVFSRHAQRKFTPLVLGEAVRETLKMLRQMLPSNIEIEERLDDEGYVLGDPNLIHQAVMNLCSNAVNAMAGQGGTLNVSIERVSMDDEAASVAPDLSPGPYLVLRVHDTGPGMNHKVRHRAFEPYFSTRFKGRGSGLGLSVVHGIAGDHGGTVICTSQPGEGTSFDLYLPEVKADSEDMDVLVDTANARGNETILIIDDEATVVRAADRTLKDLGYTVVTKTQGDDALEHFRTNPERYDLVIADLGMPGMEADELAQKLSEIREDIPIIVCGAKGTAVTGKAMKGPGLRQCIAKPFDAQGLAMTVRKVLDRERQRTGGD